MEYAMEIDTTRFGRMEVDDERIIAFPKGLLGFPEGPRLAPLPTRDRAEFFFFRLRFALVQAGDENYFFWLQSIEEPSLAFVITDPSIFFKDYEFDLKEDVRQD